MSIVEKNYSIQEAVPEKKDKPVGDVWVCGEDVFAVNPDCSWEVDRVFVDNSVGKPHEVFIAVFKRKDVSDE